MMKPIRWTLLFLFGGLVGCASWFPKEAGGEMAKVVTGKENAPPVSADNTLRFSENPNIGAFNDRRYRRVTRKSLEEESEVGSRAGSLWNTEGPSSYLFSQNKLHREGDLLKVKIEGSAKNQVDTKIRVIKKLLARLEIVPSPTENSKQNGPLAGEAPIVREPTSTGSAAGSSTTPTAAGVGVATSAPNSAQNKLTEANLEVDEPMSVEVIPTRVTERMGDGNYRVKGQQSFMIGKREFRAIVTGLVRPEDFSDEGISSDKLLDPQLDVVSLRKGLQ